MCTTDNENVGLSPMILLALEVEGVWQDFGTAWEE